ncbi:MAG: beta-mannosidase [Oscillospiraceae bacterium]|nr:beta-mannosidase [Oscillospiraceae bacterium]
MSRICLKQGWSLREEPLNYGKDMAGWVSRQPIGWYENLELPLDVHMPLIEAGVIKDPVLADYCFDSEWIEKRSWWFKNTFTVDMACPVMELVIESLDIHGDVFLNGSYLGHQASAHYPFRREVSEYIVQGENTLLVRLSSGLEYVSDNDLAEIDFAVCTEAANGCDERGDMRRAALRKPTYVYGWDWCPRVGTVAIGKNVYIECHREAAIRSVSLEAVSLEAVSLEAVSLGSAAKLRGTLEVELFDIIASADADLEISLSINGAVAASAHISDALLCSGINYFEVELTLENPQLWWPNGMGEQPLYDVASVVRCRGAEDAYPVFKYGVRRITLDTSRADEKNRNFALLVNGAPMFCKGADWIPADSIYARVSPEKYDALIKESMEANFNMLRIWGGGLYERDEYYDACDKYGILVWQDMMLGCTTVPDHREDFYELCRREFDYQTKRLRNRACIALFCGNNENHWIFSGPAFADTVKFKQEKQYGLKLCNVLMPEIMRSNCPWIPYWNSSPYGGDAPNSASVGDVHHWGECMMNPDMELRIEPKEYDKVQARFVSEYGYPGPCPIETIETYFDGKPIDRGSNIWSLHNNTFEKLTVNAGIKKHYTDRELLLDEYLLYAGLTQSLMLEYSLESLRFKGFCGGGLFWMYNDCWGEVGWTIIDYYLRRKISFYGVKRAFAPVKLILRETGADADAGGVALVGCNDTVKDIDIDLEYGYKAFDGSVADAKAASARLPARQRKTLLVFNKGGHDPAKGIWYAAPAAHTAPAPANNVDILPANNVGILPAILRVMDAKSLALPPVKTCVASADCGGDLVVSIKAETYCHGLYLDVPPDTHVNDNYFALLPGESRDIIVKGGAGKTFELKSINVG